jgi:hypothetical protein
MRLRNFQHCGVMTDELKSFREKAATWRKHAALLSEAAETVERFCLALQRGDLTEAATAGEAVQVLQKRIEGQMGGEVFQMRIEL